MENITPLAKVLAEANGIEWRGLRGTGAGDLITEQDVLGYLARVMSGEEDAPLTPVDPMPSPAELAAYSSPEMLSRAGVEPELAEFLKAQQEQIQELPKHAQPAPQPEPVPVPTPAPVPEPEVMALDLSEPAAPVHVEPMHLEPVHVEPVRIEPVHVEPERQPEPEVLPEPEPVMAEQQDDEFELEDDLEDEQEPVPAPAAAHVPEPTLTTPMPVPRTPIMPAPIPTAPAAAASGGLLSGLLSSLYRNKAKPTENEVAPAPSQPSPVQPSQSQPVQSQPSQPAPQPVAAQAEEDIMVVADTEPLAAVVEPVTEPVEVEAAPQEVLPEAVLPQETEPQEAAETAAELAPDLADVVPPISMDDRPLPPAPALGEVIEQTAPEADNIEAVKPEVVEPAFVPAAAPTPTPNMPTIPASAWAGTYLRREVDLTAMLSAREQLSEMLGDLPLSLMVARAAQRHLNLLGVSSLAIANANGKALDADLSGDVRSGIKSLSGAPVVSHTTAELLILDAGALDLDDLHYPQAITLSLGRVQDGKAALSLNGDLDVQQAARFLAEVSALLGAPVKLLV